MICTRKIMKALTTLTSVRASPDLQYARNEWLCCCFFFPIVSWRLILYHPYPTPGEVCDCDSDQGYSRLLISWHLDGF